MPKIQVFFVHVIKRVFQIFINLELLDDATGKIVNSAIIECQESLRSSVEIIGISSVNAKNKQGPGRANITSSQNFKTKVWNSLEKTFSEEIYMHCKQV